MNKKNGISAAVESMDFSVKFQTQKGNSGKTEKYAEFTGFTTLGREVNIVEFYNNLDELPEKLYARYCDFDVDEEVQMYLNAKANGLEGVPGVVELMEDVQEEERLIGILSDTVAAGLSGKIPGPKKNWMEKEREFDDKLSEAYSDPSNPITEAVMKELDKLLFAVYEKNLRQLLRQ